MAATIRCFFVLAGIRLSILLSGTELFRGERAKIPLDTIQPGILSLGLGGCATAGSGENGTGPLHAVAACGDLGLDCLETRMGVTHAWIPFVLPTSSLPSVCWGYIS